jgi:ComF family protein
MLARPLVHILGDQSWQIDLVTPVPTGKARYKERGFNQAAFLAYPLALGTRCRYSSKVLFKVRDTRSQIGLTIEQRKVNVKGSFGAKTKAVEGKHVLVVDDVTTSGATMEACAQALKKAGAENIYGLTLARSMWDTDFNS